MGFGIWLSKTLFLVQDTLAIPEFVHFQMNFKDNLCMHVYMYELGAGCPPYHSPPIPSRQDLSLNLVLMFSQLG